MEEKFVTITPSNYNAHLRNALFDIKKKQKNVETIFATLKKYLKQRNIHINTHDIFTKKNPYRYIYIDLPYPFPRNFAVWKMIFSNKKKNILICNESSMIAPFNYMKIFHFFFAKVYTWNDDLVDNKKYFKILFPKSSLGIKTSPKKFKDKKFLVLINSNKLPFYPFMLLKPSGKELYSERIKSIEFFERNIPDKFFLYGRGWNKPKKYNLTEAIFGYKKYSTYKGEADNKIELLSNFKYCLCFENLTDIKGYITEKIFDCFMAKCIPIYWGASDIEKYIPKDCFIDFRDFGNYGKLLSYLVSIDETKYNSYIKNVEALLSDKKFIDTWFEEGFAKFFLNDVLEIKNENE
ncbi:MAG: glycosyltransferase family 10 [Candidatus Daviesbacteria bacterium]|nr:glycosyltransferase family 10 [Candidatus Daviesbacteria bacterium]